VSSADAGPVASSRPAKRLPGTAQPMCICVTPGAGASSRAAFARQLAGSDVGASTGAPAARGKSCTTPV